MRAARVEAARRWLAAVATVASLTASCGTDVVRLEGHPTMPVAKPECVSITGADGFPCAYCGANYAEVRACLKCTPTADTPMCDSCVWGDMTSLPCKRCVDADGTKSFVGCTELRADLKLPGG